MKYRREVDGLRAVAVLPVIFFHAGFDAFSGGFVGVDVFFVISGYLITSIIIAELSKGTFSLLEFYERRARRILPALAVVLAACVPIAWMSLAPADLKDFWQSLVAVSLFASNVLFWLESGYFDQAAELKPLLHTWSLSVEEQFYVFFPLLLTLIWPQGLKRVAAFLFSLALASLWLAEWASTRHPEAAFFLLPTRGWELAIGALVALRTHGAGNEEPAPNRAGQVLSALGLAMIVTSAVLFDKHTPFPGVHALVPTVGTALVLLYGTSGTWVARVLGGRAVVGVGLLSYSAYLWHQPAFAFARHATLGEPDGWVYLLLSGASLGLAYLTWRYVEQPFRQKRRFGRQRVMAAALVCSAAFATVGLWGAVGHGLEGRPMSEAQSKVLATATSSPKRKECHTGGANWRSPQSACEFHVGPASWAVFGDSHAVELAYGLADLLASERVVNGVRQFSFSGCTPAYGRSATDRHCSEWTAKAVDLIAADDRIRNVVVSYRIHAHLFGSHEGVYPRQPAEGSGDRRQEVWRSYVGVLHRFVAAGKNVTLVLQAPELPRNLANLALRQRQPLRVPGVSVDWWNERTGFVRARLHEIPPGVKVIDPANLFCDVSECLAVISGTALYFDDHHMSVAGATIVAREVLRNGSADAMSVDR
jgi:peptidoglycan/LPS O-acetylase OafA/YrhL